MQNSGEAHAGDIGQRPHRHFAVAVFADDVGVDAASIDSEVLAEQIAKARRVQNRARTDHALGRQSGEFPRRVGQHIHRIGRDQQDAVGIVFHHLGYDLRARWRHFS